MKILRSCARPARQGRLPELWEPPQRHTPVVGERGGAPAQPIAAPAASACSAALGRLVARSQSPPCAQRAQHCELTHAAGETAPTPEAWPSSLRRARRVLPGLCEAGTIRLATSVQLSHMLAPVMGHNATHPSGMDACRGRLTPENEVRYGLLKANKPLFKLRHRLIRHENRFIFP